VDALAFPGVARANLGRAPWVFAVLVLEMKRGMVGDLG
jgi:hypothetical protein